MHQSQFPNGGNPGTAVQHRWPATPHRRKTGRQPIFAGGAAVRKRRHFRSPSPGQIARFSPRLQNEDYLQLADDAPNGDQAGSTCS
jgi:hypothetical protein